MADWDGAERRIHLTDEERFAMVEGAIHAVDQKVDGVKEDVAGVCKQMDRLEEKLDHFAETKEDKVVVDRRILQVENRVKDAASESKSQRNLIWGVLIAVCAWALVNLFGLLAALGWLLFKNHLFG